MDANELERFLNESPDGAQLLAEEKLITVVAERIAEALNAREMSRAELARCLGKKRSAVTGMLSGRQNITLRTLAAVAHALNLRVSVRLCDENDVQWEETEDTSAVVLPFPRTFFSRNEVAANDDWSVPELMAAHG